MAFILFPAQPHLRRPDGCNAIFVQSATEAAARSDAETLMFANPGAFAHWTAIELSTAPACVIQGLPVGATDQATWPMQTRSGDTLKGTSPS